MVSRITTVLLLPQVFFYSSPSLQWPRPFLAFQLHVLSCVNSSACLGIYYCFTLVFTFFYICDLFALNEEPECHSCLGVDLFYIGLYAATQNILATPQQHTKNCSCFKLILTKCFLFQVSSLSQKGPCPPHRVPHLDEGVSSATSWQLPRESIRLPKPSACLSSTSVTNYCRVQTQSTSITLCILSTPLGQSVPSMFSSLIPRTSNTDLDASRGHINVRPRLAASSPHCIYLEMHSLMNINY